MSSTTEGAGAFPILRSACLGRVVQRGACAIQNTACSLHAVRPCFLVTPIREEVYTPEAAERSRAEHQVPRVRSASRERRGVHGRQVEIVRAEHQQNPLRVPRAAWRISGG